MDWTAKEARVEAVSAACKRLGSSEGTTSSRNSSRLVHESFLGMEDSAARVLMAEPSC